MATDHAAERALTIKVLEAMGVPPRIGKIIMNTTDQVVMQAVVDQSADCILTFLKVCESKEWRDLTGAEIAVGLRAEIEARGGLKMWADTMVASTLKARGIDGTDD